MKQYNLIMFNMSRYRDWETSGVVNRNYHMLHAFERNPRIKSIIAVDVFPINKKRAFKFAIQNLFVRGAIMKNSTSAAYRATDKITVYSTVKNITSPGDLIPELKKLIEKTGAGEDLIVWNCNPLFTAYLDSFPEAIKIFDAVDNWAHHSSYASQKKILESNYRMLVEKSDLVFCVSESLADDLKSAHTHWIPNAVDSAHFSSAQESPRLAHIPKPRIGFLGIIQDRLDIDILEAIAKKMPEASVVLAGPVWKNFDEHRLRSFSNIYFTGPVSYKEIPEFYAGFDAGIIPYKQNDFIKSTNSMKYYEYLAAGLPVISTPSGGIEKFSGIISVADNADDFVSAIRSVLAENIDALRKNRKEFVAAESWENRMKTIFSYIDNIQ